jgi:hypothetical protein
MKCAGKLRNEEKAALHNTVGLASIIVAEEETLNCDWHFWAEE